LAFWTVDRSGLLFFYLYWIRGFLLAEVVK
jgi:hypothetical protein